MPKELIHEWDVATAEERFKFLLKLDMTYRGIGEIGNGLKVLQLSFIRKVKRAKENATK